MRHPAPSRPLRAPFVLTVTTALLAVGCEPPKDAADGGRLDGDALADGARSDLPTLDVPACPPRDTLPTDLACALNGQQCEMRVHGQWCPASFAVPWHCEDHIWRDHGSWSCNPPRLSPTDVPTAPPPDRLGICPEQRPADGASCDPASVPDRCTYPALDVLCPPERPDVATCPYLGGRWRVEPAACRQSPCPATRPADGSPCEPPARDDCVYTAPCEGSLVAVRAFCVAESRQWVSRSLCRSWGGDASVVLDGR